MNPTVIQQHEIPEKKTTQVSDLLTLQNDLTSTDRL